MVRDGGVGAFGAELRRAREARGLEVESMCAATKVPLKHLRALEAGTYDELPGGVFRRGFVRSYVGALGLEEADWIKRFEESCQASGVRDSSAAELSAFAENVKNSRAQQYRRVGAGGLLVLLLMSALALAGWCAWRVKTHRRLMPAHVAQLMQSSHAGKGLQQ